MAADKAKSVLVGFSVCPLCGGKTHVKRKEEDGKRAYSHCLDEHDKGCSHTHHSTNAQQEALMLGKTRKLQALPSATPTPGTQPEPQEDPTEVTPSPPSATPADANPSPTPAKAKRRGLWG